MNCPCREVSSAPAFQLFGITAGVEDGQNHDPVGFYEKMNDEGKTTKDHRTVDFASDFWKSLRIARNPFEMLLNRDTKFPAQAVSAAFVIGNGLKKLLFRDTSEDKLPLHFPVFPRSFALTAFHEITSPGLARCSWRRWSINATSPGVNSLDSTISSHRLRHNSICSARGRARASFKSISELMRVNLPNPVILSRP